MKTDSLFYELFRTDPRSLFNLVGLNTEGDYGFESITVKTTEKRLDGFFKRKDGNGANIFSEFQGYEDNKIYWRFFREIFTWYEQTDSKEPFVAILLFIDKKYDPGNCPVRCVPPNRMIRANLAPSLKKIKGRAGALTVLKPLVFSHKEKLPEHVPKWKADIESAELPEDKIQFLLELLEYAILQRFPKLSLKEVQKMIQLTPLEETVAVQELIQMGFEQGKLIGNIQLLQELLKRRRSSTATLAKKSIGELEVMFEKLKSQLS
ncbi:MAG: DUF2887 domain-containing protein [Desulfobacterales bacterium]|nr:DUF2887 domain-containing protein [Desulfobacterales bacterium]